MSVFKQLQQARTKFLSADIKKSGKNKFAGYEYFELGDFIPAIHQIFSDVGLCGVVRFTNDTASLTIYDVEDANHGSIEFTSPMVYAENTKGQAIQNLGSTHTYMRRYLWLMAMEIVEHDAVDAAPQVEQPKPIKQEVAPAAPPVPPKGATADQKLFVDKLIEWAAVQDTKSELVGAWKTNQKQIDAIKVADPKLFDHLKTCFTELKDNIKE
jgi:hypothetical protein